MVKGCPPPEDLYNFYDLVEIMKRLRSPDGGCPWDLEQNFATIAPYTLEEAYEVVDAIDRENMTDLQEELGDLLLQPVYHSQMASEENAFDIHLVVDRIARKMIARHPHVFGDRYASSASDVNAIWDEKKALERGIKGTQTGGEPASALDGVPLALPALLRAQKLQSRAAKEGFRWKKVDDALAKLEEEVAELRDAISKGCLSEQAEEAGDILFVMANVVRMLGLNSEETLRKANRKFEQRFRGLESKLTSGGTALRQHSLEDMMREWNEQKKKERSS